LTPKQEAFCLAYVEIGNASEAYRRAYAAMNMKPATIHCRASRLLAQDKVAQAIRGLRRIHRLRHVVTVDALTAELEEARLLAVEKGHSAAAVSATMAKAKLHGLPIDLRDSSTAPLEALTDEELDAYITRLESDVKSQAVESRPPGNAKGAQPYAKAEAARS
jgi:hypothetical protein